MTVLVIRKPTNLEQHGDVVRSQAAAGGLGNSQLEILSRAHNQHYECLESVRTSLKTMGLDFVEIRRGEERPEEKFEVIISVGGDGTLLSSSHAVDSDIPIIGIRSSESSVGYLCAGEGKDVPKILSAYKEGSLKFIERQRIKALVLMAEDLSELETFSVLNDFLYTNSNPASTTRYKILYNGQEETQKSSGLWISTATGSTAAISAAGGELLEPTDHKLQFVVRELYRFDNLGNQIIKGFFEGDANSLVIENHCSTGILALDGERGVIQLKFGDRISFLRATPIKLAMPINS